MYVRLAFAVAIHTDPDVLLVDEVLAVGDEQFQKKCLDKIREFQAAGPHDHPGAATPSDRSRNSVTRAVVLHHGEVMFQGSARLAVKNFRDILEDRRVAEAEAATPKTTPPPARSSRSRSRRSRAASRARSIQPGDDLVIRMTFSHTTPLPQWHSGIKIENQHGHLVYGTDSRMLAHRPPPTARHRHGRVPPRDVQFGGGPYFVHAFLAKTSPASTSRSCARRPASSWSTTTASPASPGRGRTAREIHA